MNIDVEDLARKLHKAYQDEAKRQGDIRHPDSYDELPEKTKEFDRALARYIISLPGLNRLMDPVHVLQVVNVPKDTVTEFTAGGVGPFTSRLKVLIAEETGQDSNIEILIDDNGSITQHATIFKCLYEHAAMTIRAWSSIEDDEALNVAVNPKTKNYPVLLYMDNFGILIAPRIE